MKLGKARLISTSLFLLFFSAAVPAYCQRGTFDVNVGQTSDKFGALATSTGLDFDFNGQVVRDKSKSPARCRRYEHRLLRSDVPGSD